MSAPIALSRDHYRYISGLIDLYRICTSLWKKDAPDYGNEAKQAECFKLITSYAQIYEKDITELGVKRKLHRILSCFKKEHRRMEAARVFDGPFEFYSPRLWYYDMLVFTVNDAPPKNSFYPYLFDDNSADDGDEHDENTNFVSIESPGNLNLNYSEGRSIHASYSFKDKVTPMDTRPRARSGKRKRYAVREETPPRSHSGSKNARKESQREVDICDAFTINLAEWLRRMPDSQLILAQHLMMTVAKKGSLGELTPYTVIARLEHDEPGPSTERAR